MLDHLITLFTHPPTEPETVLIDPFRWHTTVSLAGCEPP
jgi:hypothetical protein